MTHRTSARQHFTHFKEIRVNTIHAADSEAKYVPPFLGGVKALIWQAVV
jgi:hypothetical protein